ncbi:MAG: lytic murein transglycosylase B [Burkholderiaceae bacterium]
MTDLFRLRCRVLLALALFGLLCNASSAKAKAKPRSAAVARVQTVAAADAESDRVTYGLREDVQRFADEVAQRHGLDPEWTRRALSQARFQPTVARLIMPPPAGTAKNWAAYRARFVEPVRLRAGLEFWNANRRWLEQAEATYGVPPEIVVGIIGVETLYGQHMGGFRVIDALATLAFDFPPGRKDRSAFFRDELEQLLVMSQREGLDPTAPKGSYAGALGMPQFMPSSVNKYAVDFDADGRIDLHRSSADVIGSVAHYLAEFGWQRGLAPYFEVAVPVDATDRAVLLGPDILPTFTTAQFAERGARLAESARELPGLFALVELQNGDAAPSYVAGTTNFYAVTRYNWSSYYAMAVIALGDAVKQQRR